MKQFNTWERYFDPKHPKNKYQVARHTWIIDRVCGGRLLDVGCSGGLALFLAGNKQFVKELHGIDICEDTIMLSRQRLTSVNKFVCLTVAKAEKIPREPDYFDCVICGETLEHVSDDKVVASEMFRVMKDGGTLIISVPKNGHLSKEHVRLYSKESLRFLITEAGFKVVEEAEMRASVSGYYLLLRAVK